MFDLDSQNVGRMYDSWLQSQADAYYGGGCDGEPQAIEIDSVEFEGYDEDGNPEVSYSYIYNCDNCDYDECPHWKDFHEREWEERQEALREDEEEEQELQSLQNASNSVK